MKRTIQKFTLALAAMLLAGAVTSACGQDSIVYVSGPSFGFQYGGNPGDGAVDLNQDGAPDFSFQLGLFLCTADIPTSACSAPFYVLAARTNAILSERFNQATLLRFGSFIGSASPTNSAWSSPNQAETVVTYFISPRYGTSGLYGQLADAGVGYVGVRFSAADGAHYGWVRLRIAPSVTVVDWAYESRPNTTIRAGVIGSGGESVQFTANFHTSNGTPSDSVGTFILTGNTLRGELTLAGSFESATVAGPAPARAEAKPFASLGQPLVARTDFTSFLGDSILSHGQIVQLLRSADYVSLDGGAVVGQIEPLR